MLKQHLIASIIIINAIATATNTNTSDSFLIFIIDLIKFAIYNLITIVFNAKNNWINKIKICIFYEPWFW